MKKALFARGLLLTFLLTGCGGGGKTVETQDLPAGPDGSGEVVDVVVLPDVGADVPELLLPDAVLPDGEAEAEAGCQPGDGCFMDKCEDNSDCLSGLCVDYLGEGVCTQTCQEECPPGWSCKLLGATGPDPVYACLSNFSNLCKPCGTNADCKSPGGQEDVCVGYGDEGSFCGGTCLSNEECPWGFSCGETTSVDGVTSMQCLADAGVCPCSAKSVALGLSTPCASTNEFGTCTGKRICTADGLSDCDAAAPSIEECNGVDDDCDGDVDEPMEVGGDYVNLCDDGNECTQDVCGGEVGCSYTELDSGECKDGDACTVGDHCEEGSCVGNPVVCDDNDPCTDDSCDGAGGCLFVDNDAACDDGDACTVADQCSEGVCAGIAIPCDCQADADCDALEDGDLCNGTLVCDLDAWPYECKVDPGTVVVCPQPEGIDAICLAAVCDPGTGQCGFEPDHEAMACDDGDSCTIGDKCVAGECISGGPLSCADDNPCTDDSCDPGEGCVHTANAAPCSDQDLCTLGDQCVDGICVPGTGTLSCDDGNPCTTDWCNPAEGCAHGNSNEACSDGNACTTGDHCVDGKCVWTGATDCDDGNVCTTDSCDPGGGCVFKLNAAPCDDGNVCTTGDHCHLGECISSGTLSCDDGNPCTMDSCNPAVGCAHGNSNEECDDGNACTDGDQCSKGWCMPGAPLDCNDGNPCTVDSCDPADGCVHANSSAGCDDGDACTVGDQCVDGECASGPDALDCDDGNGCTDDSCDPAEGCVHSPNEDPCDDGDVCTLNDVCAGGSCASGPDALDCDDGNVCTDDGCHPLAGCSNTPNEAPCEGGTCQGGECVPNCEPIAYGTAGIGVNNGWTCVNVCAAQDAVTVSWVDLQEQIDYCHLLHPTATIFTANPSNFSYPIYEPQNNQCKLNANGAMSQNFAGNGTPQYGDQILCRCQKDCPCIPNCDNKECGDDGCGGSCGQCGPEQGCQNHICVDCPPGSQTFNYTGAIADWTVPSCVTALTIEAWGAEGGRNTDKNYLGGRGARMKGTFGVVGGSALKVLVGGKGEDVKANAGGGGGSFVWNGATQSLLIAAGGGGGGGYDNAGVDAVTGSSGTHGNGLSAGGGVDGHGGTAPAGFEYTGGGGAGWKSNGNPGHTTAACSLATPAKRPLEGGAGGLFGGENDHDGNGGFGGGGGGQGGCTVSGGAGGGGGYSGGGPGGYLSPLIRGGGGGGSFNGGGNPDNTSGTNTGNGKVVISW